MFKGLVGAVILGSAMLANASQSADAVIAAATEANKQAKSLGYEWNVTGKAIKAAQAALKAGNEAEALKLAEHAKYMAEASIFQAGDEKKNWMLRVPK